MSLVLNGTTGVTFNDASLQGAAASPFGLKNRIINGDMRIDQRNAGASVTPTTGQYSLDRWLVGMSQTSKFSVQQNAASVTPPTGFTNYLGITSLSSYSILATDFFQFIQKIEGFNTADLAWGTANAKTITLSFWARSSLTGTFGGSIRNSNDTYSYCYDYTISSANTWEYKTITIAGATSGTWLTNNGVGIEVRFSFGMGSTYTGTAGSWGASSAYAPTGATSVVGTNGATFYITGVQLEQNTSATPFERRLYGQELINCQRYFLKTDVLGNGNGAAATYATLITQFPVIMRASPSISVGGTTWAISDNFAADANTSSPTIGGQFDTSTSSVRWAADGFTGLTSGRFYNWRPSTTSLLNVSAEL
jgi:hypothetical protein